MSSFFAPFSEDVLHRQSPGDTDQNPKAGIPKSLTAKTALSQVDVGAIIGPSRCRVISKVLGRSISVENLGHRLSAFGHEEEQQANDGNGCDSDAGGLAGGETCLQIYGASL